MLGCIVCNYAFTPRKRPVVIPCGHIICSDCFKTVADGKQICDKVRCPKCGKIKGTIGECHRLLLTLQTSESTSEPPSTPVAANDRMLDDGLKIIDFVEATQLRTYEDLVQFFDMFNGFVDEMDEIYSNYNRQAVDRLISFKSVLYPFYAKARDIPDFNWEKNSALRKTISINEEVGEVNLEVKTTKEDIEANERYLTALKAELALKSSNP